MKSKYKILFNEYKRKTINWLKEIYFTNAVLWKSLIIGLTGFITLTCSFVFRQQILQSDVREWDLIPGFLEIYITQNTGIAFSGLENADSSFVYFVQSLPVVIGFIILIFSKSKTLDVGICFVLFGGLANIIDRSLVDNYKYLGDYPNILGKTENAVVDYLRFSFIPGSAIFNFPDVSIIFGIIIIVIFVIYLLIKDYIDNSKKPNIKKIKKEEPISKTIHDEERFKKRAIKNGN